jgi:tetratricopeptide (TPR) repeat protein
MSASTTSEFVGREAELSELGGALDAAVDGRGGLFLLVGEPGIGKTRLAGELAARAAGCGMSALWGRCWEAEARPPYWPWIQILRPLVRMGVSEELAAALGPGLAYLAQVVPELQQRLPRAPLSPPLDAESARLRLFDAAATFLAHAGATAPLLIVFDDLHWADLPSLHLLDFVAHALPQTRVLAVGTYRDVEASQEPAVADVLGRLARSARHVPLRGLSEPEVGRFIAIMAGQAAPASVVRAIHRETEGNPFFVDEVVRCLRTQADGPWVVPTAAGLPISQGVRGAIRQRLAPLHADARSVLTAAAVIGRAFEIALLAALCERSVDALLEALTPALEHDIVARVPATAGRYRFSHALVRETIYEELPPTRRVSVHRALAELLEARYANSPDVPLSELAHHFHEAAAGGDEPKAVDYAVRAGEHAMAMLAYEEAVVQYRRALQLLEVAGAADPDRQGALLLALGTALVRSGQDEAAKGALRRAAAIARRRSSPTLLADAALRLCEVTGLFWTEFGRTDEGTVRMLEEALRALGSEEGVRRARVMARLATELCWTAEPARTDALSHDAVALARQAGDPSTLAYTLLGRILCASGPDRLDERAGLIAEILAHGEGSGDREVAVNALMWRIGDAMQRGDQAAMRADMTALIQYVEALRQPADRWMIPTVHSQEALLAGHFADAEAFVGEILTEPVRLANAAQVASALMFLVRREQGRLAELEAGLKTLVYQYPDVSVWRASLAWLYAELGRAEESRVQFDGLAGDGLSHIRRDLTWPYTMACLAESCVVSGEAADVELLYDALLPYADRNVVAGPFYYLAPVAYYLGLLATELRRWADAERHFEQATEQIDAFAARPHLARVLCAQARMRLARAAAHDRETAADEIERALAIARPLGMQALCARLDGLRADLGGDAAPAPVLTAAVLRREGEFWTLAHAGKVSRLRDSKGLRYLARLLREPGREFHVLDLAHANGAAAAGAEGGTLRQGPADTVLDERAKHAFRSRLEDLREELAQAQEHNDRGRIEAAQTEIDALTEQLARAVGLGGRDRVVGAVAERARSSVTKALRHAIRLIGADQPELSRRLTHSVHTGTYCCYEPAADSPLDWEL